jgi:Tfp pilus assembly protein PilF
MYTEAYNKSNNREFKVSCRQKLHLELAKYYLGKGDKRKAKLMINNALTKDGRNTVYYKKSLELSKLLQS